MADAQPAESQMTDESNPKDSSSARDLATAEAQGSLTGTEQEGRVRHVRLRTSGASLQQLAGGELLVCADEALGPYPKVFTDRVAHWANVSPDRIYAAQRGAGGMWHQLTYAQVLDAVRCVGQALLDRGLSAVRPVAILSENDLEHLLLMLAGQHVGIPTAHLSPDYKMEALERMATSFPESKIDPNLAPAIETENMTTHLVQ